MSELELKFQIPPGGRASLLKAVGQRQLTRVELDARYVDTADHLLARHRIALRLRRENGAWVQTLKASRPHSVERFEHEVALPEGAEPDRPDLALHDGTEVGGQLRALLAKHGDPELVETYRAEVVRLKRLLPYREALVEWSLDEGRLVAGDRVRAVSELELELKDGDPQLLYAMGRDWQSRHGLWLDVISKAHRGTLLVTGRETADPQKAEPPVLGRTMRADGLLRAVVAACLSQILPNAGEIAAGSERPEHVHQLRVGLRRLRTALRELGDDEALRAEVEANVGRVFDALGESRDRHVFGSTLAPVLERAGAPLARLEPVGDAPDLARLVRSPVFQGELLRLMAWADSNPGAPEGRKATTVLRRRLDRLCDGLSDVAGQFEQLTFEEQHHARKRLKRLRYVAEFAAPLFKASRVDAWAKAAGAAQDALGEHIDHALATQRFEAAATADPRAWFAVGWLRSGLPASAKRGRKGLARLLRADRFW